MKTEYTKIILVTGMYRSASTWIFNIVRNLHTHAQHDFHSLYSDQLSSEIIDKINQIKFIVIKSHHPQKNLVAKADLILCSYRNPIDAINSLNKCFNVPLHDAIYVNEKACQSLISLKKDTIHFKYENLFFNQISTVEKISDLMQLNIKDKDIFKTIFNAHKKNKIIQKIHQLTNDGIINRYKPFESDDPESLWHFNHTRNKPYKTLNHREQMLIFKRFESFYKSHYPFYFYSYKPLSYAYKALRYLVHRLTRFR
jgi:hypothetical protein